MTAAAILSVLRAVVAGGIAVGGYYLIRGCNGE